MRPGKTQCYSCRPTVYLRTASIFVCLCVFAFHAAPSIQGGCTFVRSTNRSLSFRWNGAKSANMYRLVGHSESESTTQPVIKVNGLHPGSRYTFKVWAVDSEGRRSNNITCTGSTGRTLFMHFSHCAIVVLFDKKLVYR